MGLKEAKKYIDDLHKKQGNPYVWPDFLTGLPDKAAILTKLDEVYPKLGECSVSFIRIANIHPYLIKYGPEKHADIIEWAAAILKTTAHGYKGVFVGTFGTHDFIAMGKTKPIEGFIKDSSELFSKKAETFYNKEDRTKGVVLSFLRNGRQVDISLMGLVAAIINRKTIVPKDHIIPHLGKLCTEAELSAS